MLSGSWALLVGGLLFWLVAQLGASQLILKTELSVLAGVLALTAVSAWGWRQAAARLAWRELDASKWLLWPVMLLMVLYQVWQQQIPAAGLGKSGSAIALPAALMMLRRDEDKLLPRIAMGLHLSLLWMILLAMAAELYWFARSCHGAWRLGKRHCDGCRRWGDYGTLRGCTASRVAVPGMACALRLPCHDPCGCGAGGIAGRD